MEPIGRRLATRGRTWPETTAMIDILQGKRRMRITGTVTDIGSRGMFLKTEQFVPGPTIARIAILFDPNSQSPDNQLTASGEIVRRCPGGVGIRFTSIDLGDLLKCIVARMNRIDDDNPEKRHHLGAAMVNRFPDNVYPLRRPGKKKSS